MLLDSPPPALSPVSLWVTPSIVTHHAHLSAAPRPTAQDPTLVWLYAFFPFCPFCVSHPADACSHEDPRVTSLSPCMTANSNRCTNHASTLGRMMNYPAEIVKLIERFCIVNNIGGVLLMPIIRSQPVIVITPACLPVYAVTVWLSSASRVGY